MRYMRGTMRLISHRRRYRPLPSVRLRFMRSRVASMLFKVWRPQCLRSVYAPSLTRRPER